MQPRHTGQPGTRRARHRGARRSGGGGALPLLREGGPARSSALPLGPDYGAAERAGRKWVAPTGTAVESSEARARAAATRGPRSPGRRGLRAAAASLLGLQSQRWPREGARGRQTAPSRDEGLAVALSSPPRGPGSSMSWEKGKCLPQGGAWPRYLRRGEFYSYSSNYFYALVFHLEPQAAVSRTVTL